MANPKDEHEIPKAAGHPMASGQRGLATSTDPNNAARLAKVPYGTGGNPGAMKPDAPAQPVGTGAPTPAGATTSSSPMLASAPAAPAKPNSFGDAAAAANSSAVTQVRAPKPSAPAARQSYDAGFLNSNANPLVNQIPVDAGRNGPASDGSADSALNSGFAREVSNTLAAIPGGAAVPGAAARAGSMLAGVIGGAAPATTMAGKALQAVGPVIPPTALAGAVVAGQGRDKADPNVAGSSSLITTPTQPQSETYQTQGSMGPPNLSALGGGASGAPAQTSFDRRGMTNAQVGELNPAGRVTMTRQANGTMAFSGGDVSGPVSYMNSSGNPLAGAGVRGDGFSSVGSAAAGGNVGMGPNGSFAYASDNPLVSSAEQNAPASTVSPVPATAGGQTGASASPAASGAVDAALSAAMQRGDFDAVRAHYAGRGQAPGMQGSNSAQQGFTGEIGQNTNSGNAWGRTPEQQRRDAETQASSIHKQTAANGNAALKSLDAQNLAAARNQAELTREQMRIAGEQSREAMRQEGENFRSSDRNRLVAADLNQRSIEAGSRAQLTNIEVAKAQRNQGIIQRYDNAKDDAERAAIMRQHPDAFGIKPGDQADWRVQVTPQTKNLDGSTTAGSIVRYNQRTGQVEPVDVGGGQAQPVPQDKGKLVSGQIYQTARGPARWSGEKFDPV